MTTAEIFDPVTEQVTQVAASSNIYRGYHSTATLLPDGRVLTAGGEHDHHGAGPTVNNTNAEVYEPAYLHNGPRPTITDAPETVSYGQTFFVQTPDAASIARALMVVPGSTNALSKLEPAGKPTGCHRDYRWRRNHAHQQLE